MSPDRPIRPLETATIARLYMQQGLLDEAEALYLRLLERRPEDSRLSAGLVEVRRRRDAEAAPPQGDDRVELTAAGERVRCTWSITESGIRRAATVARGATPGVVTLRAVSFPRQEERPHQDIQVGNAEGSLSFRPPPGATLLSVAVGLLGEEDRFVAIAHCDPLSLETEN